MTEYVRATAIAKATAAALKCPETHPYYRLALRIVRCALAGRTQRAAAKLLGIDEHRLSELLRAHPISGRVNNRHPAQK